MADPTTPAPAPAPEPAPKRRPISEMNQDMASGAEEGGSLQSKWLSSQLDKLPWRTSKAPPTAKSVAKKIVASEDTRKGGSYEELRDAKASVQMNDGFGKDAWTTPSKGVKDPAAPEGTAEEPMAPVSTGGPNNGTDEEVDPMSRGGIVAEDDGRVVAELPWSEGGAPPPEGPAQGIYGAEGDPYKYEVHPEEGVRFRKQGERDWQSAEGREDGAKEAILAQVEDGTLSMEIDMSDLSQHPPSVARRMRAARYGRLE